ncbi:SDR family oxidoreductase [Catenovulum sp. SM1970]|uniref:SDR family oxidoreductase n=1 Tax=Marinifaba aquimaris TaxID=2741323 RepID=UPI001574AD32|nr:SDR family oxidoreductase [Marinifaba aquimaris]NTS75253.1 SDR family oxidoreductase [Marinifaba aquimaris]
MTNNTNRKTILITGCSTGIGLCVAKELKKLNYQVLATARQATDVDMLAGLGFESFQLDYADAKSIESAFTWAEKTAENSQIYALFNNGAYGQPGALEDVSRQALTEQFEANVFGWHQLTRLMITHMRKQGFGRIIQNSSVLGIVSMAYRGAYNASKYAIEGLSDTLRLELANTDIHVCLVEPGPILSEFRANALKQFDKHIDVESSVHKENYINTRNKLVTKGPAAPFTLPPEAVFKKVLHALESSKPKARYYVTFPTYLFGFLKRILPTSWLDSIIVKSRA